jgi:hypothetical protein
MELCSLRTCQWRLTSMSRRCVAATTVSSITVINISSGISVGSSGQLVMLVLVVVLVLVLLVVVIVPLGDCCSVVHSYSSRWSHSC